MVRQLAAEHPLAIELSRGTTEEERLRSFHIVDPDGFVRRTRLQLSLEDYTLQTFDWHLYQMAVKAGIPARPLPTASGNWSASTWKRMSIGNR